METRNWAARSHRALYDGVHHALNEDDNDPSEQAYTSTCRWSARECLFKDGAILTDIVSTMGCFA